MLDYIPRILEGALLTVAVSLLSLAVSIVLGLLGASAKLSGHPVLSALATVYTTVVRGVPELVLMLLVFYGGTIGLTHLLETLGHTEAVDINPFVAGVGTIGFIYGAYMTETFRGAMLAIPRGQMEAAWAFGMGRLQTFIPHHTATNGSLRPAWLYQQLVGTHQKHCARQFDRVCRI
jgi:arginine/ornithine transport system permease protein